MGGTEAALGWLHLFPRCLHPPGLLQGAGRARWAGDIWVVLRSYAMGHGSSLNEPSSPARCHPAPAVPSARVGFWGVLGSRGEHMQGCAECVCACVCRPWRCMRGGFGQRRVFIGVHTCPEGGRRKECGHRAVPSKTKVGPSAVSLLCPRGAWLVQGSPKRLIYRLSPIHFILAQMAMEYYWSIWELLWRDPGRSSQPIHHTPTWHL